MLSRSLSKSLVSSQPLLFTRAQAFGVPGLNFVAGVAKRAPPPAFFTASGSMASSRSMGGSQAVGYTEVKACEAKPPLHAFSGSRSSLDHLLYTGGEYGKDTPIQYECPANRG